MPTITITADQFADIANTHDDASNGRHNDLRDALRVDYIGRGYDRRPGVAYVGSVGGLILFTAAVVQVLSDSGEYDIQDVTDALAAVREDSMGRAAVYYWSADALALDAAAAAELVS